MVRQHGGIAQFAISSAALASDRHWRPRHGERLQCQPYQITQHAYSRAVRSSLSRLSCVVFYRCPKVRLLMLRVLRPSESRGNST